MASKIQAWCCVPGCKSVKIKGNGISFHHIPESGKGTVRIGSDFGVDEAVKIDRREAWLLHLKIGKTVNPHVKVCSLHFSRDNFILPGVRTMKARLKLTAVPDQNLPGEPKTKSKRSLEQNAELQIVEVSDDEQAADQKSLETSLEESEEHQKPTNACGNRKSLARSPDQDSPADNSSKRTEEAIPSKIRKTSHDHERRTDSITIRDKPKAPQTFQATKPSETKCGCSLIKKFRAKTVNKSVQMTTEFVRPTISTSDCSTQVTSGDLIRPFIANLTSNSVVNTLTGIPTLKMFKTIAALARCYIHDKKTRRLLIEERVLLTMMKLKHNHSFPYLLILFPEVAATTCKLIFTETLQALSRSLKQFIALPSTSDSPEVPDSSKPTQEWRMFVDCFQVVSNKIKNQGSHKSYASVKFLRGMGPNGSVGFVSSGYPGGTSDEAIFERSNVLSAVGPNDAIMVNEGLHVWKLCSSRDVVLLTLPNDKSVGSKEIEKSRQRIDSFAILNSQVDWNLVDFLDEVFVVICAISNLSLPHMVDKYSF